jgi:hypothetical protein
MRVCACCRIRSEDVRPSSAVTAALYPKVKMRARFNLLGRRLSSLSQKVFVLSVVHVLKGWPLSPCTATILTRVSTSNVVGWVVEGEWDRNRTRHSDLRPYIIQTGLSTLPSRHEVVLHVNKLCLWKKRARYWSDNKRWYRIFKSWEWGKEDSGCHWMWDAQADAASAPGLGLRLRLHNRPH